MSCNKDYYVYEYVRLDYNEPFYIGKGTENRWKDMNYRNRYFLNIVNKVPVAVRILHDNLDERTAFEYECWYIWQLRDIEGYNLVNILDGGEGSSGLKWSNEQKENFKRTYWTEERRVKHSLNNSKENNPMFGKNYRLYKTEKQLEEIAKKKSESMKGKFTGNKNPFFNKTHSQESKQKISKQKMKPVLLWIDGQFIGEFESVSAADKYFGGKGTSSKILNGTVFSERSKYFGIKVQYK